MSKHKKRNSISPALKLVERDVVILTHDGIHISKYDNGQTRTITYKDKNGEIHREIGPAYQEFFEDGTISYEMYGLHGYNHRTDGPATVQYNRDGKIVHWNWCINGYSKTEIVEAWIAIMGLPRWEEWTDEHKVMFKLTFVGG